jgi:uncharacterized membrane protein YeaQ/YmgE (transglycosylase-associated protein family)
MTVLTYWTYWYAWLAIGAAAGLAGMIWPFRRGARGVAANLLLGIVGGLLGPSAAIVFCGASPGAPLCLAFAACGALALLVAGHVAWFAWAPHARHPARGASRGA